MEFDLNKKEFIESLLHTPITSYKVGEGCKKGDNVAGSLKSIVATTESGETISAVIKTFPPKEAPTYAFMKETQVFRTESDAYTVMVEAIEKFVNTRENSNENIHYRLPMPKHFDHFNDDENDYICLEDIRPQGYVMPNIFKGITYLETSLALKELARFHAYTYALIRQEGEQIFSPTGKFTRMHTGKMQAEDKLKEWGIMVSGSVQNSVALLQSVNPSLAKILEEKIPAEMAGSIQNYIPTLTDTKVFPCIIHGDFWSNNILFKYDEPEGAQTFAERKPTAVQFVDFQFTRRGNIFEDLVYFLFTSTNTEFRKKYLNRVLEDYYNSFNNTLDGIKVPLPINFTLGFLIDIFWSCAKPILAQMCFAIPLQMGKPMERSEQGGETKTTGEEGGNSTEAGEKTAQESLGGDDGNKNEPLSAEDQAAMFFKMFIQDLRAMVENSPPALKRLEEITDEVLASGRF